MRSRTRGESEISGGEERMLEWLERNGAEERGEERSEEERLIWPARR